jgi:hypothetical protein
MMRELLEFGLLAELSIFEYEEFPDVVLMTFRCLTNIAADSCQTRDAVMVKFPMKQLIVCLPRSVPRVQKAILKLMLAYTEFPVSVDFVHIFIFLLNESIERFPHLNSLFVQVLEKIGEHREGSEWIGRELLMIPSYGTFHEEATLLDRLMIQRKLKGVIESIKLMGKLVEHEIISEPQGFFHCSVLLRLMGKDVNQELRQRVLRLLGNLVIISVSVSRFLIREEVLNVIYEELQSPLLIRREALYLATNLVRVGDCEVVETCLQRGLIIPFVDALLTEDKELVQAVLCGFGRINMLGMINLQVRAKELFEESEGPKRIEMLLESENEEIAELARAFQEMFVSEPRVGFRFE